MAEKELYDDTIAKYKEALSFVPEPKKEWETSTWIYTAMGDAYWFKDDDENIKNSFYDALSYPDGTSCPFINLRLGQAHAELNEMEKAKEYLLRAYMLDGDEIFEDEEKHFTPIKDMV